MVLKKWLMDLHLGLHQTMKYEMKSPGQLRKERMFLRKNFQGADKFLGPEEQFIINGQSYDAAVGKFREIMKEEPKIKREGMFENSGLPVIETVTYTSIPVVRVSKLPEFLLFLGIRIHG